MSPVVLATVTPSAPRRLVALGAVWALGALLIFVAFDLEQAAFIARAVLLAAGAGTIWLGDWLRRATLTSLELTEEDLRDSSGTILARMDEVVSIERSALALKPSNGFVIVLKSSRGRFWAPGLWWRMGRRVGVGGVCSAREAKAMSDVIALKLAEKRLEGIDFTGGRDFMGRK
ncbi:MAG: hypothetical protein ACI853_000949 [Paracoccaceae bacterium]|jgi:hypothetical protein